MLDKPKTIFTGEFTRQEAIPEEGIIRAVELMRNGRLHRYNTAPGEISEVALLEKDFAEYMGTQYCVGFSSCGSSLHVALKCVGVQPGDKVLCNAFTLAPVPGAIENARAEAVLVEITKDYVLDLADLKIKAKASEARYLMLSHMRGHIVDMEALDLICQELGLTLIEDCAHTMGCRWGDRLIGTYGAVSCFSTQAYKHMNSGEGGLLVTNDDDIAAKAILYSGSYMHYDHHLSRPAVEVFDRFKKQIPNFSLRMSNLQAALLRPQLKRLDDTCARWNERYFRLEKMLSHIDHIYLPFRPKKEHFVGSSFQFTLEDLSMQQVENFVTECARRGVEIKWFGRKEPHGFTSSFDSWQYMSHIPDLPDTKKVLAYLCDFRVTLTFTLADCDTIAAVIQEALTEITA